MNYRDINRVEKDKIRRKSKVIKQCVNCGNYKDLSNGETVVYTKDRNLKFVCVCDIYCKRALVKREIEDLLNKIEWLKNELD